MIGSGVEVAHLTTNKLKLVITGRLGSRGEEEKGESKKLCDH